MISVVAFSDFLGRLLTSYIKMPSKKCVRIIAVLRILMIGTTILALVKLNLVAPFNSNWYALTNLIMLAFTNGIAGTFSMI